MAVLEAGAAGSGDGSQAVAGGSADDAGDATGTAVDVAALALPDGLSLTGPLVVLALLLLAADVVMARRRAP
ncbi:MAG: hypothetical protein KY453_12695 [Gemmatimonadetes bacterium]|nr:hypothetical protein [Gemmatimonadota bacterium]